MSEPTKPPSAAEFIDRERIRGAARVIGEGTDAADVTPEQVRQVAADVELFTRTHKISGKDVATAVGYSPGVVSDFLNGKYAGNKGQVAIDLENWLLGEEHRRSRPATTQFVWTNVAICIKGVVNYCRDFRKIGLVYGPDTSGLGKTMALQAIHQELGPRASTLATIDKVDANPSGLLRKLCFSMHINDSGSNRQRFERLKTELTGRSHVLLIDQVHSLRGAKEDKPFYILADLFDATNASQVWCGTADLVAYLNRQRARSGDESLAQIRRRIFPCVDLIESLRGSDGGGEPLITIEQVREMFARNKLRLAASAARFLCELCNHPDSGAIGLCVQLVEYATMIAESRRQTTVDLAVLKEAMRRGFTPARADLMLARVEADNARAAQAVPA
jgi:DNA transposition AAA+ family ATPase